MAGILDDLGRRIQNAGKTTVQKTKELTDIAKLNSAIADEERTQKNLFLQLGREYFNNHAEDAEEALSRTVQDIADSRARVRNLQHEINDIRGIRVCEDCGAEVRLGAVYCTACGVRLPDYVAPAREPGANPDRCIYCGRELNKADRFCPTCGTRIDHADTDTVGVTETGDAPEAETGAGTERQDDAGVERVSGDVVDTEDHV
ncbi:MAG: zinc ribbon domain-containing protein [Lachnospiraceae bacterium]|nr:zinc ribbon domain-containing protein [Lachnospiraceae bacterium]